MINTATKIALQSTHDKYKHGVIITKGSSVLATGFNHGGDNHGAIHAEYHALNKLWPNKRKGATVWSVRITPGGKLSMAKPCAKCHKMLIANGIKKVIYTTYGATIEILKLC